MSMENLQVGLVNRQLYDNESHAKEHRLSCFNGRIPLVYHIKVCPSVLAQCHCPYPKLGSFGQGTGTCGLHHAVACQDYHVAKKFTALE